MGANQGKHKTSKHDIHTKDLRTITHAIASIYSLVEGYCKYAFAPNTIPYELAQIIAAYYLYTLYLITPNNQTDTSSSPLFRYTLHYSRITYQLSNPYQTNKKHFQSRKILLVGPKSSGKSTFLKQLHYLFHPNYHSKLLSIQPNLIKNLKQSLCSIAMHSQAISMHNVHIWKRSERALFEADQDITFLRDRIAEMDVEDTTFDVGLCKDFSLFWENVSTQNAVEWVHEMSYIDPSYIYLCANMHNYWRNDYIPTYNDYVHCAIDGKLNETDHLKYIDTIYEFVEHSTYGTHGNGWFDPVLDQSPEFDAVIFVANLSGFYRCDYHQYDTNNLLEEIDIFESVINRRKLREKDVILLLNLSDIFAQDVVTKGATMTDESLRDFFMQIQDPQTIIEHVLEMFMQRVVPEERNHVHCFVSNAMDADMVGNIFQYMHHEMFERKRMVYSRTNATELMPRISTEGLRIFSRMKKKGSRRKFML